MVLVYADIEYIISSALSVRSRAGEYSFEAFERNKEIGSASAGSGGRGHTWTRKEAVVEIFPRAVQKEKKNPQTAHSSMAAKNQFCQAPKHVLAASRPKVTRTGT